MCGVGTIVFQGCGCLTHAHTASKKAASVFGTTTISCNNSTRIKHTPVSRIHDTSPRGKSTARRKLTPGKSRRIEGAGNQLQFSGIIDTSQSEIENDNSESSNSHFDNQPTHHDPLTTTTRVPTTTPASVSFAEEMTSTLKPPQVPSGLQQTPHTASAPANEQGQGVQQTPHTASAPANEQVLDNEACMDAPPAREVTIAFPTSTPASVQLTHPQASMPTDQHEPLQQHQYNVVAPAQTANTSVHSTPQNAMTAVPVQQHIAQRVRVPQNILDTTRTSILAPDHSVLPPPASTSVLQSSTHALPHDSTAFSNMSGFNASTMNPQHRVPVTLGASNTSSNSLGTSLPLSEMELTMKRRLMDTEFESKRDLV